MESTGGAGYTFEDNVAAHFAIALLAGRRVLGTEFGAITKIDFQASDCDWLLDDLLITFVSAKGERSLAISVKSGRVVTQRGFPAEFVHDIWEQWFGTGQCPFHRDRDVLALAVGQLASTVKSAWDQLFSQACETEPERVVTRFTTPKHSSAIQRALFASLRCPQGLSHLGDSDNAATAQLIKHLRLLHFDFNSQPSRELAEEQQRCQSLLTSRSADEGATLWNQLVALAAKQRPLGGTLSLYKLLNHLRREFRLQDHPDYEADWRCLTTRTSEELARVRDVVGDGMRLDRSNQRNRIATLLGESPAVVLVGDSGSGKSVLAKQCAEQLNDARAVVWLSSNSLDACDPSSIDRQLGITNGLGRVLDSCAAKEALLVLDGIDRFSSQALQRMSELIRGLMLTNVKSAGPWRVLFTSDASGWERCLQQLVRDSVDVKAFRVEPIGFPPWNAILDLLSAIPLLKSAAIRPELRSAFQNLKILDCIAAWHAARSQEAQATWTHLSDILDELWAYWIGSDSQRHGRGALLMKLAEQEGRGLAGRVPVTDLDQAESQMLGQLESRRVLRFEGGHVGFAHDLIGDLARLRTLIGAENQRQALAERALLPRWHRAIRFYGQRLLEQSGDDVADWRACVESLSEDDCAVVLARDLLLESVVFAANASELLEKVWSFLIDDNGQLLYRLLKAFLHSCTFPDPQIPFIAHEEADTGFLASVLRLPDGPRWLPALHVLHRHLDDLTTRPRLFDVLARVCLLWLRSTPGETASGESFPGRRHAAEIAVRLGREVQCLKVEHVHFSDDIDEHVFEPMLYAAPDLPDRVSAVALELAQRRDASEQVVARAEEYRRKEQEQRRKLESDPEYLARRSKLGVRSISSLPRGPLREPWPDGPSARVDSAFQQVCLGNAAAFQALIHTCPEVAREVLLAVCIESPRHEDSYGNVDQFTETHGTEFLAASYPPMYFRGPFLSFLRLRPEAGLETVLRLVNFATERWAESQLTYTRASGQALERSDLAVMIRLGDATKNWLGDGCVYGWYRNFNVSADSVVSSLMALEKWLYDELDADRDIAKWVDKILACSQSVAFAGLLGAVGLRTPSLFEGPLKPLLGMWQAYDWQHQLLLGSDVLQIEMKSWVRYGERVLNLVKEWHLMPHRKESLRGRAVSLMLSRPGVRAFFQRSTSEWGKQLESCPYRTSLELVIARFDPENYQAVEQADGTVHVQLEWPRRLKNQTEADLGESEQALRVMSFPARCRWLLDERTQLTADELEVFWKELRDIAAIQPNPERGLSPQDLCAGVCGGIAVLCVRHLDWLAEESARQRWCMEQLTATIQTPPPRLEFEFSASVNTLRWDCFVVECLVALLAANRADASIRETLAELVSGCSYSTTQVLMNAAFRERARLGEDFVRLQNFAVLWAALRSIVERARVCDTDLSRWERWRAKLIGVFRDRRLTAEPIEWARVGQIAGRAIRRMKKSRFPFALEPEPEGAKDGHDATPQREWHAPRRAHRLLPGLDTQLLQAAFDWIPSLDTASDKSERSAWVGLLQDALRVTISMLPDTAMEDDEVEGTPYQFDYWVFQKVAIGIVHMTPDEAPDGLWKPLFDLGAPSHYWISSFLSDWFIKATRETPSPTAFIDRWKAMVEYALASDRWACDGKLGHRVADLWTELMALDWNGTSLDEGQYPALIAQLKDQYEQFAIRWLRNSHVASRFAAFLGRPAGTCLRGDGVRWLNDAIHQYDVYHWRDHTLGENLAEALRVFWQQDAATVQREPDVKEAFLGLLGSLMQRQNAAAYQLRDEVIRSIGP